jgi:hypothetical protein
VLDADEKIKGALCFGALEDLFHLAVVILIEPMNLLRFFPTLQLSAHVETLHTVAGLNAQPTLGPELPFAAEAEWHLHQCEQAGGPNRTDAGNLVKQFCSFLFPALTNNSGCGVRRNVCSPSNY